MNNNRNNNNRQDMENFIFQNPVKLIMGRGMIARLAKEIPSDKRIMITFGGGSVKEKRGIRSGEGSTEESLYR